MSKPGAYFDPELEQQDGLTVQLFARVNSERLLSVWKMADRALGLPRRLGAEASRCDLALDKKCSRAVSAFAERYVGLWWGPELGELAQRDIDPRVTWQTVARDQLEQLAFNKRDLCTYALRTNQERWGASKLNLLEQETYQWRRQLWRLGEEI